MANKNAITEQELLALFIEHYSTCPGKPAIMQFLSKKLCCKVNFANLGFGKLNVFLAKHEKILRPYLEACKERTHVNKLTVDEDELIAIIETYGFEKSLSKIRELHGHFPFAKFGFGTYQEFCARHFDQHYDDGSGSHSYC
jgi:hypothetical protein